MFFLKFVRREYPGLHLGSGDQKIDDFLNIDANLFTKCDVVAGIKKIKLAEECTRIIYASHVFEHISRYTTSKVLGEWYRLLKPGGRLYILVPNMETLFQIYLENIKSYQTAEGKYLADFAMDIIYGGQINRWDYHYYGYSFETLRLLLESVGFKKVSTFERNTLSFCSFQDAGYAEIGGIPVSLNIVAEK